MRSAHLYLFSDASPSDWLVDGQGETWHTIANFNFQSDPSLQSQVDGGKPHIDVLGQDNLFKSLFMDLEAQLLSSGLRKWNTRGNYKSRFCQAFTAVCQKYTLIISAWSFQEKTLRASKVALKNSYNKLIGGIGGLGIDFEEFRDSKGRLQLKHSFINPYGYHEIQAPENQMLVLLFMSCFVADQYRFYRKDIVNSKPLGFDHLLITIVSDKLSGDNESYRRNEENLRNLINPEGDGNPFTVTLSPRSDTYLGDLLVDNLAGWLNAAITDPGNEFAEYARQLMASGVWNGWYMLVESTTQLEIIPALSRLARRGAT